MSTVSWKAATSGDWAQGANWSSGKVPGSGDDVTIGIAGTYTVTVSTTQSSRSLTLSDSNSTLAMNAAFATGTLSALNGTILLGAGQTMTATGPSSLGATNSYGPDVNGPGTLATSGTTTLATQTYAGYADIYLANGATWANKGTALLGGRIYIGDNYNFQTATITNAAGATFNLTDDVASIVNYYNDYGTFSNGGLLEKTGGTGTSTIETNVGSTGTISIGTGTLGFTGGGSFGGSIKGSGTIGFGGGTATLSGAVSSATGILVYGGVVDLETATLGSVTQTAGTLQVGVAASIGGAMTMTAGAISLGSGKTLALAGPSSFGATNSYGPSVIGTGTLATSGTTTLATQTYAGYGDLYLGHGATWANTGTVIVGGRLYIGDSNAFQTATLTNAAGAVFNLINDASSITNYYVDYASFANAGLLEKTGGTGTGTSTIDAKTTNTGTISVGTGTLAFDGGGSFGGVVNGTGTIGFGGGTATVSGTISAATSVLVYGGVADFRTATLGRLTQTAGTSKISSSASVTGTLTANAGVISLTSGKTLAASGPSSFGVTNSYGAEVTGPGTLSTAGTTTLATQTGGYTDLYLANGATWANKGKVLVGGRITIGDNNAFQTATLSNAAGATFNFTTDIGSIQNYYNDAAIFTNGGLLEKTGGTATSLIEANVSSTGTIAVGSGTIGFTGGGTFAGTLTGSGTIGFGGGTASVTGTVSSATNILLYGGFVDLETTSLGNVTQTGGTLSVGTSASIGGTLSANAGLIELAAGKTLAMTGPSSFGVTNAYGPDVAGTGTLATSGTTTLADQTGGYTDLYLSNGATWANKGKALIGGRITLGDNNTFQTATLTNAAGATFNLVTDIASILDYYYDYGTFTNGGLLEKTGGTGVSTIEANVSSTGTIAVGSGTLGFTGGGSFGGTITGTGTIGFGGGTATLTGAVSSATQVLVYGGVVALATATLGNVTQTAGELDVTSSASLGGALIGNAGVISFTAGRTLSLAGPSSFGVTNSYGPDVTGAGTLLTGGTTTLAAQSGGYTDLYLAHGATWVNKGTALVGGRITIGDDNSFQTATLTNAGGAVFNLDTDIASIVNYYNDYATFSNAGLLEKTVGTGLTSLAAQVTNTGTLLVGSGTLSVPSLTNLAGTTLTGGTFQVNAGATLQLANNVTITSAAANVILNGTGSTIESLNTTGSPYVQVAIDSTLSNVATTGALRVLGGRNFTAVANGGSFDVYGALQISSGTFAATRLNVHTSGTLLGHGIVTAPVASTGLLDAINGGTLALTSSVTGSSQLRADTGSVLQLHQAAIATATGSITLNGAGSVIQFGTAAPFTAIETSLTAIASTGTLAVLGSRGYATSNTLADSGVLSLGGGTFSFGGLTVAAGGQVSGFGTISHAVTNAGTLAASGGTLTLAGSLTDTGTLATAAGAVLAATAGGSIAGPVSGTGTLSLSGAAAFTTSGTLSVGSAVINAANVSIGSGSLGFLGAVTNNGSLAIGSHTATFSDSVGGTGTISLGAAGKASLLAGSAATEKVNFLAASGDLALGTPLNFAGTIGGFVAGDTIDLLSTLATGKSFAGGVLTVTGSSGTLAKLHLAGSYTTASFTLGSDSHGGTFITHS